MLVENGVDILDDSVVVFCKGKCILVTGSGIFFLGVYFSG